MNSNRVVKLLCVLVVLLFVAAYASAQTAKPAAKAPQVWPRPTTTRPAAGPAAYPMIGCTQNHPGRWRRGKDVFRYGDAHMARNVADHVVAYSAQRFHLTGTVKPQDFARASDNLYEHLKWKLGNPPAIAGQFVTAGYEWFDKSYSWEAAAALVGSTLPMEKNGSEYKIPRKWAEELHRQAEAAGQRFDSYLENKWSIPPELAKKIAWQLTGAANQAIEHIGINMPKNWGIDPNLVTALLAAQRASQQSAATSAANPLGQALSDAGATAAAPAAAAKQPKATPSKP